MVRRAIRQLRTADQWLRCDHSGTYVDVSQDVLTLEWQTDPSRGGEPWAGPWTGAGLAVDTRCRFYRSAPEQGQILVYRGSFAASPSEPQSLLTAAPLPPLGDFSPASSPTPDFVPRGLAMDDEDCLFVVDEAANRVVVVDVHAREILRSVHMPAGVTLRDVACVGREVHVLTQGGAGLYRMSARTSLREAQAGLPMGLGNPGRIAAGSDGRIFVLDGPGTGGATVVDVASGGTVDVAHATDLEVTHAEGGARLIVAREKGADFVAYSADGGFDLLAPPLRARGYDGLGIAADVDGTIVYYSEAKAQLRRAASASVRYVRSGRVAAYLLDAGQHRNQWGRVFVDACVPPGTALRMACIVRDDLDEVGPLGPRRAPAGQAFAAAGVRAPSRSPATPPQEGLDALPELLPQDLHRRRTGPEIPWTPRKSGFETYEAPVHAEAGRYLWLVFELEGNGRRTPKIGGVRVEVEAHDLVRRLPRLFSEEPEAEDFLRRYLSMVDGLAHELDLASTLRHILLDPAATPEEVLPWLAGFVGLVLDERLDEAAKRTLVSEAISLWRFRGTPAMLRRLLQIAVGVEPIIIERFRLRGLGGAWVGERDDGRATSIVGVGLRVGGAVGEASTLEEAPADVADGYAHRFTVVVPAPLDAEQRRLLEDLLETHRPAHTLFELCTVEQGMRVGRGLHVGMTSLIGRTSGFTELTVGQSAVGRGGVLGVAGVSTRVGGDRVGKDTRLG